MEELSRRRGGGRTRQMSPGWSLLDIQEGKGSRGATACWSTGHLAGWLGPLET